MPDAAHAPQPARPHLFYEERLRAAGAGPLIAGVDEAGRGPLAGPVVAAAVILPEGYEHPVLNDSKKLSAGRRAAIHAELIGDPRVVWACAMVHAGDVDRLNILRATHAAMRQAILGLPVRPSHALIDGRPVRDFPVPTTALVQGDGTSLSIAAASVIAKVTRDRLMEDFDSRYPAYGFARHKGYATGQHLAILARDGPCPIHRFSFRPVAQPLLEFAERHRAAGPEA